MNNLAFIDLVNVMDFLMSLENISNDNQRMKEIHDILQDQNKKLDKILEELENVRHTRD